MLEKKSGNICETRTDKGKVTMDGSVSQTRTIHFVVVLAVAPCCHFGCVVKRHLSGQSGSIHTNCTHRAPLASVGDLDTCHHWRSQMGS